MKQIFFSSLALLFWVCGCASTIPPGKPFNDSERRFFDDGVDVVENIASLQGQFGFEEREDLDARCNLSDVIGVVNILSVNSNVGADGEEEIRIEVVFRELLYGEVATQQIVLRSGESALGYTLLKRYESSLTGTKVLFMRTFPSGEDTESIGHHFHLSMNSPAMLKEVKRLVRIRRGAESDDDRKPKVAAD